MPRLKDVSGRVSVDDVTHYQDDLDAGIDGGVHDYGDRSALLPSKAVVVHANYGVSYINEYLQYLNGLGFGASEVIPVNGEDTLFASIQHDPETRKRILGLVNEDGCRLDAFCSYDPFAAFVSEMGLDKGQVRSTLDLNLVRELDNKRRLRELDVELPGCQRFPEHIVAETSDDVLAGMKLMLEKHGAVYLKADDLESGVGTLDFEGEFSESNVRRHLERYQDNGRAWIIEQSITDKFEGSVQWYITPEDEALQKRFMSRQYLKGPVHQGNGIPHHHYDAFPSEWSKRERRRLADRVWSMTKPFAQWAKAQGYVGYLGFDFAVDLETHQAFLFEANARKTGATYPESVRWQVEASGRLDEANVAMLNCHPDPALNHFQAIVERLEYHGLAMDPTKGTGVIVANPRCLIETDEPKCILLCVDKTLRAAENALKSAIACVK